MPRYPIEDANHESQLLHLQTAFVALLAQMPNLQSITYASYSALAMTQGLTGGSIGSEYRVEPSSEGVGNFLSHVFAFVEASTRRISLSLSAGRCQVRHLEQIEPLSCMSSLRVMLPRPVEDAPDPKSTLAGIVHCNANLQSFALEVNYYETCAAPFLIPGSLHMLRSLHLQGRLSFQNDHWANWDSCIDWAKLRSLELVELPLIVDILRRLESRLPNLRVLKLRAYQNRSDLYERLALFDASTCSVVKSFLLVTPVEELDIVGFTRDIALHDMVRGSRNTLHTLRIHYDAEVLPPRGLILMPNLHLGLGAFLSAESLQSLLSLCPSLKRLGLDIEDQEEFIVVSNSLPMPNCTD